MVRCSRLVRVSFYLILISLGSLTFAQDNVGEESTVRYPASYFSEWSPVTAQDMLDRIPGLSSGGGFGGSRGGSFRGGSSGISGGGPSGGFSGGGGGGGG